MKVFKYLMVGFVCASFAAPLAQAQERTPEEFKAALQQLDRDTLIMLCINMQAKIDRLEQGISEKTEEKLAEYREVIKELQRENAQLRGDARPADVPRANDTLDKPPKPVQSSRPTGGNSSGDSIFKDPPQDLVGTTPDRDSNTGQTQGTGSTGVKYRSTELEVDDSSLFGVMTYPSVKAVLAVVPSGICPDPTPQGQPLDTALFTRWVDQQLIDSRLESKGIVQAIDEGQNGTTITIKERGHSWHDLYIGQALITWTVPDSGLNRIRNLSVGNGVKYEGMITSIDIEKDTSATASDTRAIARVALRDAQLQ